MGAREVRYRSGRDKARLDAHACVGELVDCLPGLLGH